MKSKGQSDSESNDDTSFMVCIFWTLLLVAPFWGTVLTWLILKWA